MMKKIFILLIALTGIVVCQAQNNAQDILNKTSAAFTKAGGIEAKFRVQLSQSGKPMGTSAGTIRIKNDKFVMETQEGTTWFNGKTQWSYLSSSEEVNISNPTQEELQSINPYLLLNTYKKGYSCKLGTQQTYAGKQIYEIILLPTNRNNDISQITLYIQKQTYQPLYIEILQKNKSLNKIIVTGYRTKQNYPDKTFNFNKQKYPNAEEIDLR